MKHTADWVWGTLIDGVGHKALRLSFYHIYKNELKNERSTHNQRQSLRLLVCPESPLDRSIQKASIQDSADISFQCPAWV